ALCDNPALESEATAPVRKSRLKKLDRRKSLLDKTDHSTARLNKARQEELLLQLREPLLHVSVVFFLQLRRERRSAVQLAGLVLAREEFLFGPLIVDVGQVGGVDDLLDQMRRNKNDAFVITEHNVTGKHDCLSNLDRNVDADHIHLADRRRMRFL